MRVNIACKQPIHSPPGILQLSSIKALTAAKRRSQIFRTAEHSIVKAGSQNVGRVCRRTRRQEMKPYSPFRRSLVAIIAVGVLGTSAGLYFQHQFTERASVPLSNHALVGRWSGTAKSPTGRLGHRHYVNFPVEMTFRPDSTVVIPFEGNETEADYAARGKSITYSHIRFRSKLLSQSTEQQASLAGHTLTLVNLDKSVVLLRHD